MFTIAAPPMKLTCTLGLGEFPCEGTRSSKHPSKSHLVPVLSLPMCDNDGGHAWFSCSKNSSIFPCNVHPREEGTVIFQRVAAGISLTGACPP